MSSILFTSSEPNERYFTYFINLLHLHFSVPRCDVCNVFFISGDTLPFYHEQRANYSV